MPRRTVMALLLLSFTLTTDTLVIGSDDAGTPPRAPARTDQVPADEKPNTSSGGWLLLVPFFSGMFGGAVVAWVLNFFLGGYQFRKRLVADLEILLKNRTNHWPKIQWQLREVQVAVNQLDANQKNVPVHFDFFFAGEFSIIGDIYQHIMHMHSEAFMLAAQCYYTLSRTYEAKKIFNDEIQKLVANLEGQRVRTVVRTSLKSLEREYYDSLKIARETLRAIAAHPVLHFGVKVDMAVVNDVSMPSALTEAPETAFRIQVN